MEARDARYGTRSTKFAAALLTLGYTLKREEPFTVTKNVDSGKASGLVVSFWFEPGLKIEGAQGVERTLRATEVENIWNRSADGMPWVVWMREALERRDWIIQNLIKRGETPRLPPLYFRTDNLWMASVLSAQQVFCYGYKDRRFFFQQEAEPIAREFSMGDEELFARKLHQAKTNWQKKAIIQQDNLMGEIKRSIGRTVMMATNRHGDTGFAALHGDPNSARKVMRELMYLENLPKPIQ